MLWLRLTCLRWGGRCRPQRLGLSEAALCAAGAVGCCAAMRVFVKDVAAPAIAPLEVDPGDAVEALKRTLGGVRAGRRVGERDAGSLGRISARER